MFEKGALVLYKNQPAIVTECGEKYAIQFSSADRKKTLTQSVREKDIVLLHEAPCPPLSDVYNVTFADDEKERLRSATDDVRDLLQGEEQTVLSIGELSDLLRGSFSAKEAWAFYTYLQSASDFAPIPREDGIFYTLRSKEKARAIEEKQNEKNSASQLRDAFLKRLKSKKIILPDDAKFMQEIEAFALGKTDKSKLMKDAAISETQENAHKLLLDTQFWPYYKNPHPMRWGLSMQSAQEKLSHPPKEERVRVAHTAFAIDNAWSSDPDDAVFFDGTYLWVHIADPASTVLPDTKIDRAAMNRGATLYLPEGAARMLSEESLEDYALGLREESYALSFKMKLDENATILETEVLKTIVSVKRLTYSEASAEAESAELSPLFAIAKANIEKRKKNGAVFIDLPEVHIGVTPKTDKENPIVTISSVESTTAADMVREMMLLAGEAASRFAFKNKIPFPYVSQEEPDIPKDLPLHLAGQYRLRRSMRARSVGTIPSAHAGLGLGMYSQVTSPLRRYSDLVAHQQLRAFIDGQPLLTKDEVLNRISTGDASAMAAVKAERKSNLHWTLCYLIQNPSWQGEGIIVELKDRRATVLIPSLAHETQIAVSSNAKLNDTVLLKASNIDIPKLTVNFRPID